MAWLVVVTASSDDCPYRAVNPVSVKVLCALKKDPSHCEEKDCPISYYKD